VARPSLSIRFINPQAVQAAAGIRFESVHDRLWANVCFHDCMNVIRSHVRSPETPAAMEADLAQSAEHGRPAISIEATGCLVHLVEFYRDTRRTGFG
jgi:hypothetical protein